MADHGRMELGGYTTWVCLGCPSHGRHPKASSPQTHADQTGHNVQVQEVKIHLVYPAGQPPTPARVPMETTIGPASVPITVGPDDLAIPQPAGPVSNGITVNLDPPRPQIVPVPVPYPGGGPNPSLMARAARRTGDRP